MEGSEEPEIGGDRDSVSGWLRSFVRTRKLATAILILVFLFLVQVALLPFGDIAELKTLNPAETAFMKYHAEVATEKGKAFKKRQMWVPLGRISKNLIDAVIVAEDGSFWSHSGFDWFEVRESFARNVREGRAARGASTISQQLIKNLYLSPSKNPMRKLKEWILTWWLERKLSKSRILELYLNLIEWGDGIYGAQAASQIHFGKSVADLSLEEAARLATVIPNPRRMNPHGDSRYVARRAELIVRRMQLRGLSVPPQDSAAVEDPATKLRELDRELDSLDLKPLEQNDEL